MTHGIRVVIRACKREPTAQRANVKRAPGYCAFHETQTANCVLLNYVTKIAMI